MVFLFNIYYLVAIRMQIAHRKVRNLQIGVDNKGINKFYYITQSPACIISITIDASAVACTYI